MNRAIINQHLLEHLLDGAKDDAVMMLFNEGGINMNVTFLAGKDTYIHKGKVTDIKEE